MIQDAQGGEQGESGERLGRCSLTAQGSGAALQGDLPAEGVPPGLLRLQLLLGAREHVPPQQQHLGEVVAHQGGAWGRSQSEDRMLSV